LFQLASIIEVELSEGNLSSSKESELLDTEYPIKGSERGAMGSGSSEDDNFHVFVKAFQEQDCGCSYGKNGKACGMSLSFEDTLDH